MEVPFFWQIFMFIKLCLGERKSKLQCWNHFEIKILPCVFIYWWKDCEERICPCLYAIYEIKASNNLGFWFMVLLGFELSSFCDSLLASLLFSYIRSFLSGFSLEQKISY